MIDKNNYFDKIGLLKQSRVYNEKHRLLSRQRLAFSEQFLF